jgi:hypothetical protein
MATKQQKDELIASIKDRFKTILSYDLERELIRKNDLGSTIGFEPIRETLIKILNVVHKLNSIDLTRITFSQLTLFNDALGKPHSYLLRIAKFNIEIVGAPQAERNRIITGFEEASDKFIDAAGPILWSNYIEEPDDNIHSQLAELISDVRNDSDNARKDAQIKLAEINQVLENAKSAAGKIGVASHAMVFKVEAEFHSEEAKKWLGYTRNIMIAAAVIALFFLILMFLPIFQNVNVNPVQFTISKVVILTIFFIGISLCNRNYKAHKHNSIVNKHRQNALSTFETFVKAADSDEQTKNAVLLQTTQSIFASQNTGYNSAENDSDVSSKIIEIVKSSKTNQG